MELLSSAVDEEAFVVVGVVVRLEVNGEGDGINTVETLVAVEV